MKIIGKGIIDCQTKSKGIRSKTAKCRLTSQKSQVKVFVDTNIPAKSITLFMHNPSSLVNNMIKQEVQIVTSSRKGDGTIDGLQGVILSDSPNILSNNPSIGPEGSIIGDTHKKIINVNSTIMMDSELYGQNSL
jgi:hypothetical protein